MGLLSDYEYYKTESGVLYCGDALDVLRSLEDESIDCVVTSPPYWSMRDYGVENQLGLESTFEEYIDRLLHIFDEIYRVLKSAGTCWVNLGDAYSNRKVKLKIRYSVKRKSLCLIPERFAISMVDRGWILRNQIIWHKPNAIPSSVKDRFTVDFEKIFFFTKSEKYYFNQIKEPNRDTYNGKRGKVVKRTKLQSAMRTEGYQDYYGKGRNKRTVWRIPTLGFKGAHFAVFPPTIPEICIKAGCPENGVVLDPFMGSGTTAEVCVKLKRWWVGIDINKDYCRLIKERLQNLRS